MKEIRIKFQEKEQILEEMEVNYLYSYILRFEFKNNTGILKYKEVTLSDILLKEFRECIFNALEELLKNCYNEPPLKRRQKHPTFFEKFVLSNKKYVVDYTTSVLGRLIYTLYVRLSFIDKVILLNEELFVISE